MISLDIIKAEVASSWNLAFAVKKYRLLFRRLFANMISLIGFYEQNNSHWRAKVAVGRWIRDSESHWDSYKFKMLKKSQQK